MIGYKCKGIGYSVEGLGKEAEICALYSTLPPLPYTLKMEAVF